MSDLRRKLAEKDVFYAQLRNRMHEMFHEDATREEARAEAVARYTMFTTGSHGGNALTRLLTRGVGNQEIRAAWGGRYCGPQCGPEVPDA